MSLSSHMSLADIYIRYRIYINFHSLSWDLLKWLYQTSVRYNSNFMVLYPRLYRNINEIYVTDWRNTSNYGPFSTRTFRLTFDVCCQFTCLYITVAWINIFGSIKCYLKLHHRLISRIFLEKCRCKPWPRTVSIKMKKVIQHRHY